MQATPTDPSRRAGGGRALTRRGLLAAGGIALVGAGAAGCAGSSPASGGSGLATPRDAPSVSPDVALATLALAELRATRLAVTTTVRRFPGLRGDLRAVSAMHATHEAALVDAVPEGSQPATEPPPYAVPQQRPAALSRLREREAALQDRLGDLAVEARSGAFAGLLASMSAGTAQRVATWPGSAP